MRRILLAAGLLLCVQFLLAQESDSYLKGEFRAQEARKYQMLAKQYSTLTPGQEGFDVTYYKLDLNISVNPTNYLSGSVLMVAKVLNDNLGSIVLDLMRAMTVDTVVVGGVPVNFSQQSSTLTITLNRSYAKNEMLSVRVVYEGVPGSSGFGSFAFIPHSTASGSTVPWVWSLSEPYGAKDWWPCKDTQGDKADSVDIWVTCESRFKVGSEGKLVAVVDNGNGTRTHKWQHRYPIATYLVSIAVTDYSEISGWFKYSQSDSMQVLDYALGTNVPQGTTNIASAAASMSTTLSILQIYSDLFGLYPFIKEKYGFSQFGWGGGMEHQTMTSIVNFGESLQAHETAHQWFGDMITTRTWPHIWLNEGFATYCVALYYERKLGPTGYWNEVNNNILTGIKGTPGSVYVTDTSSTDKVFSTALVYHKGGTVLHMLRHVLGDSLFFRSMRQYAQDPRFRFATASTEDFQSVCETASGKAAGSLDYFFKEWIYGEKYPSYQYQVAKQKNDSSYTVRVTLNQTTGTNNPNFFQMPIDFRFAGTGLDTIITVFNSSPNQVFTFILRRDPTTFQLDPNNWILKDASGTMVNVDKLSALPDEFALLQNYPNPFNPSTIILFDLAAPAVVRIEVYNALGALMEVLINDRMLDAGRHQVQFNGTTVAGVSLPSGVYYYRLKASGTIIRTRKMVYIR
jgi:aminopeptidase N